MAKRSDFVLGSMIVGVTIMIIVFVSLYVSQRKAYDGVQLSSRGEKIAVVELWGTIYESRRIVNEFKEYGKHRSVKAVVFRIDSPGGGVAASQEIYQAVKRVRDSGKPVVASLGSVAASGGYYVACGADTIMANPGTTTGSIGVVAEFPIVKGLLDKIGVRFEMIRGGRYKGTGSPYQEFTEDQRRRLQKYLDDAYAQFVDVVSEEREIPRSKVLTLADGSIYTGRQALDLGLIDVIGDYEDAVKMAAQLGGIHGDPLVVKIRRRRVTLLDLVVQQIEGLLRGMGGLNLKYAG